ncbi:MAG: hypothetical protein WCP89_00800 [archaeon]
MVGYIVSGEDISVQLSGCNDAYRKSVLCFFKYELLLMISNDYGIGLDRIQEVKRGESKGFNVGGLEAGLLLVEGNELRVRFHPKGKQPELPAFTI